MAASGGGGGASGGAIRAGAAFIEVFLRDGALGRGLDAARRKIQAFSLKMAGEGAGLAGGAGGILGGAGWKALDTLGETANLSATAKAFGLTAEAASRLFGVMGSAGSDIRDATEGIVTLGQRVSDALGGKGQEAAELFQRLGVGADQFAGLKPDEQFYKLIEALRGVKNPAEQVKLLLKAVGEDTGKNLIKVLGQSADEIQQLGKRFEMSAADMKAAEVASSAYSLALADVSNAWRQVATALAPALAQVAGGVSAAAGPIGKFIAANRELVLVAAIGVAGVGALGVAMVAVGSAIAGTATVLGVVGPAIGLLLNPIGLTVAAVAGLTAAFLTQTETGLELAGNLSTTFGGLLATVRETWGGITAALRAGDLKLAGEVAMAGLNVAWEVGIAGLRTAWREFSYSLADVLVSAFGQVKSQFRTITTGVAAVLIDVLNGVGVYSDAEAKGMLKELWKENEAQQRKAAAELAKVRADLAAARAAEDAASKTAGTPELDAARKRLADAEQRARDAEAKAKVVGQVNQPNGPAPLVGSGARGAFGANLVNQLGTGAASVWLRASVEAAKRLTDINGKMDKLIDVSGNKKAVFS